jgi:hypothetical protein
MSSPNYERWGRKKDRKFNRTSQTNFAPHPLANPIFIDRFCISPIPTVRMGRINAKNRHTLNPKHKPIRGEQKIPHHQAMR